MRWDLDYQPVFEVDQDILGKVVSDTGGTLVTPSYTSDINACKVARVVLPTSTLA